jgi:hypothetical protein
MMAPPRRFSFALLVALASMAGLGSTVGCGDEDHPGAWMGTGGGDQPLPGDGSCSDGVERECHVTISERNGVLTCMAGTQVCEGSRWGQCEGDGMLSEQATPGWYSSGGLKPQAATSCMPDNLCDPSCLQYDDDDDLIPDSDEAAGGASGTYDWQWGSLSAYPGGLVKKGAIEPCFSGYDCQFNMYCSDPASGDCDHSMCEEGDPLDSGCDDGTTSDYSCTELICDADPVCCGGNAPCAHDPCVTGAALSATCTGCVDQICDAAATAHCCSTTWDQACVDAVVSVCGNTCGCKGGWYNDGVLSNCYRPYTGGSNSEKWVDAKTKCSNVGGYLAVITTAAEQTYVNSLGGKMWIGLESLGGGSWQWVNGSTALPVEYFSGAVPTSANTQAAYMAADTDGTWTPQAKDSSSAKENWVCETSDKQMGNAGWDSTCVEKVKTLCNAVCTDPATGEGECVPYPAGYIDETCDGVNLTVAPSCSDGGTYVIPVCNHGTETLVASAASPIRIVSYQGNSTQFPQADPGMDTSDHVLDDSCFLQENIEPGECVVVSGCLLDNLGGVIVNPQTAGLTNPAPITECSYMDNWSIVKKANANGSGKDVACGDVPCGQYDGYYDELVTGTCTMDVPDQAEYEDSTLVTVTHVYDDGDNDTDDDEPLAFTYVSSATNCASATGGLGWYYDNAASPTTITLCTNACTRVKNTTAYSGGSEVLVEAACAPPEMTYDTTNFYFTYTGTCEQDRGVQWADLGYSATIPSGGTIDWYVATSSDPATLPAESVVPPNAAWTLLGQSDETTPDCPTNVTPGCALDIFTALGELPDAQLPYLAIAVVINPAPGGSSAPTVESFNVTYSCPFNQ